MWFIVKKSFVKKTNCPDTLKYYTTTVLFLLSLIIIIIIDFIIDIYYHRSLSLISIIIALYYHQSLLSLTSNTILLNYLNFIDTTILFITLILNPYN